MLLKMKSICVFMIAVFLIFSCENHVQEDDIVEMEASNCDPNTSFTTSVKPIIDANCVSCHNGSQPPNLSSYNGVSSNASNVKTQVISRRMPLGGSLTTEEIELIRCWIDNGALNN